MYKLSITLMNGTELEFLCDTELQAVERIESIYNILDFTLVKL